MHKWILVLGLVLFSTEAFARFEDWDFMESIQSSKYSVIVKPVKIESTGCGYSAYLEVVEDLKGNAPKFIDAGISEPVMLGETYFMVVEEGKAKFHTDTPITFSGEMAARIEECKSIMPEYTVNHLIMGQIAEKRAEKKSGKTITNIVSRWIKKPLYLAIPSHVDAIAYSPVTIEVTKKKSFEIEDKAYDAIYKNQGKVVESLRIPYEEEDLAPMSIKYPTIYYNWEQLKQVWQNFTNICNPEHSSYNQEKCKTEDPLYKKKIREDEVQKEEESQRLKTEMYWREQGCKCHEIKDDKDDPFNFSGMKRDECEKACGIEKKPEAKHGCSCSELDKKLKKASEPMALWRLLQCKKLCDDHSTAKP